MKENRMKDNNLALESHNCPQCGASVKPGSLQCEYCGTWFNTIGRAKPQSSKSIDKTRALLSLPIGVGEFGISSHRLTTVGIIVAFGLYVAGWLFEDTQYWLDAVAITIWVGVLPLWLFGVAFVWRANRMVLADGLLFALVTFLVHVVVIWAIRGRLWDDHIGIAGMVAGASLAGWLLGRLMHGFIRWRRIQSK